MNPSRILVCGGRDYNDWSAVSCTLDSSRQFFATEFCIIEGGATGADALAGKWAELNGVCRITVKAQWNFYDKRAGMIRNRWMANFCMPELVIAFPGGIGTKGMIQLAEKAGIQVYAL